MQDKLVNCLVDQSNALMEKEDMIEELTAVIDRKNRQMKEFEAYLEKMNPEEMQDKINNLTNENATLARANEIELSEVMAEHKDAVESRDKTLKANYRLVSERDKLHADINNAMNIVKSYETGNTDLRVEIMRELEKFNKAKASLRAKLSCERAKYRMVMKELKDHYSHSSMTSYNEYMVYIKREMAKINKKYREKK